MDGWSEFILKRQPIVQGRLRNQILDVRWPEQKNRAWMRGFLFCDLFSALARFELTLRLVDHVDAAFATHNPAVTVPILERAERVLDLHGLSPVMRRPDPAVACAWVSGCHGKP